MKNFFVAVLLISGLFAAGIAALLWDYFYYPLIDYKAKNTAIAHLKASFKEDFVIDAVTYSKPFGDDKGSYDITAHPTKKQEIKLRMTVSQDFKMNQESFKETMWRYDTNLEYVPLIGALSPGFSSYAVNAHIPEELINKYLVETPYSDIRKLHENVTEEYLFMGAMADPDFTEQRALEYGYRAVEFMKTRHLKNALIEIDFYPRSLVERLGENDRKIGVFDFRHKFGGDALQFRIEFDTRRAKKALNEFNSPEDLKPFLTYYRH
ncbi:hypothetical protein GC102_25210 [Paenibacillus sp. LMG 31460]|uniref:Uncharacterized protein n=1 Tax=Paenibacillus germinis TaxID=2654979 RepID=A0ABX1Z6U6_9BACL|nr:hypothetical protein [Paenibacillus germinis]NOU89021.1 hypothetical protein [Paenibacillus germinis]